MFLDSLSLAELRHLAAPAWLRAVQALGLGIQHQSSVHRLPLMETENAQGCFVPSW